MPDAAPAAQAPVTSSPQSGAPDPKIAATPAPAAPAAPKTGGNDNGTGTFIDGDQSDPAPAPTESWRDRLAGGDEKFRKQLDRFGAESDFGKAYREMEKLKSTIKAPLPDSPTPEQLAQYRKDNGIPETPDKYDIKLPDGIVMGETDKPVVAEFLKSMHDKNVSPDVVNAALGWYYQTQDVQQAQHKEAERIARKETIEELRKEWGPEYKASQGMIKAWLDKQPDDAGKMLTSVRDNNGRALLNNATFVKWLNNHIRETDPSATVIHDAAMTGVSIKERVEAIQKIIRDEPARYYKGAEGQRLQDELNRLMSASA